MGGANVVLAAPLRELINKLLSTTTVTHQRAHWRALFSMLLPGVLADQVSNLNHAAKEHNMSAWLRRKPCTVEEYVTVCLMIVAGTQRPGRGMAAFFKEASGYGKYPNFDTHMNKGRFAEIIKVMPFAFAPESCMAHAADAGDNKYGWKMFRGLLTAHAKTRRELIAAYRFTFDEDMIPYAPKNTATGALPNITHEPRKPVPLGTMLRSVCCCVTNVKMAMEIVEDTTSMHRKAYHDVCTAAGRGAGGAVTARLWEKLGADGVNKAGAEMIADAFFGSVHGQAWWKAKYKVNSFCLVKNNYAHYPKEAMLERLAELDRGSTVVATAVVDGVRLMAIGYKFSLSRPPNLLLCTTGSSADNGDYEAHYEDPDTGQVCTTAFPRPAALNKYFLREHGGGSTLCDDHNHLRQGILDVCRNWSFSSPWMHHFSEMFIGGTWVDMFYLCKHVGLTRVDHTDRRLTETLNEFTDRVLGYVLADREAVDPNRMPKLVKMPSRFILAKNPKSGRERHTKQVQLACTVCLKHAEELATSMGERVVHNSIARTSYYCDLCTRDLVHAHGGIDGTISAKTTCAVHSDLRFGCKRKRTDPYATCWAEHLRTFHPGALLDLQPDAAATPRASSPRSEDG